MNNTKEIETDACLICGGAGWYEAEHGSFSVIVDCECIIDDDA